MKRVRRANEGRLKRLVRRYRIAMTSAEGTYIAGRYMAVTPREACKKAEAKHGPCWTYYWFDKPNKSLHAPEASSGSVEGVVRKGG